VVYLILALNRRDAVMLSLFHKYLMIIICQCCPESPYPSASWLGADVCTSLILK